MRLRMTARRTTLRLELTTYRSVAEGDSAVAMVAASGPDDNRSGDRRAAATASFPFNGRTSIGHGYYRAAVTAMRWRPLARRRARTLRPFFEAMRARKPCARTRLRLLG